MKINIVCAGNRNFIIPMKVMLKSLAVNTRKNVEIFVLNKEWKGDDKIDFIETFSNNKNISIKFLDMESYECLNHFKTTKNIPIDIGIAPLSDFTIEDIKVPNDINISPSNNIPINTTFIFIIKFITSTYSGFTI